MALPSILDRCPITPECTARKLFRDEADGKLYYMEARSKELKPHKCNVRGSEEPEYAYLAVWKNKRTGRTRYVGPVRQRRSALLLPADSRSDETMWELLSLKRSKVAWEDVTHEIIGTEHEHLLKEK